MSAKLVAALAECALHAQLLDEALAEVGEPVCTAAELAAGLSRAKTRLLDQIAYRFGKLQDSLGEKVLPLLLEAAEEPLAPTATFGEKLARLERLGWLPSADGWRTLREIRNALAHDYPELPELKAAQLARLVAGTAQLLDYWHAIAAAGRRFA